MIAVFNKGKFLGKWQDQEMESDWLKRMAASLSCKIQDVRAFKFDVKIRNDQSYSFTDDFKLQVLMLNEKEVEVEVFNEETQEIETVTKTINTVDVVEELEGTEILP